MRGFIGLIGLFFLSLSYAQEHRLSTQWPKFLPEDKEKSKVTQAKKQNSLLPFSILEDITAPRASPESTKGAPSTTPVVGPAPKPAEEVAEWTKRLGHNISLRGTSARLYIKAGETTIVLDESGDLIISAGKSLSILSQKDILFKAGRDIRMEAGGKVIQQLGTP